MKNIFSYLVIFIISVCFLSCKKNWICQCTQTGSTLDPVVIEYPNYGTKKQAIKECESLTTTAIGGQTCVLVY